MGFLPLSRTSTIPKPSRYVTFLENEYKKWAFSEERCLGYKGKWRSLVFRIPDIEKMDLEIGTGNGYYFCHHLKTHPNRFLIGLEMKYKPLIQTVRRALKQGSQNMRMIRYHATYLDHLFGKQEIDDVIIHFPDPWPKRRQNKKRLIQDEFLEKLSFIQKPCSKVFFKTDSKEYFNESLRKFSRHSYSLEEFSEDFYQSEYVEGNHPTFFESIFVQKRLPIYYACWKK